MSMITIASPELGGGGVGTGGKNAACATTAPCAHLVRFIVRTVSLGCSRML